MNHNDRDRLDAQLIEDGEEIRLGDLRTTKWLFPMACCDCLLTHVVEFDLRADDTLVLRYFRDDETTSRARAIGKSFFRTKTAMESHDRTVERLEVNKQLE